MPLRPDRERCTSVIQQSDFLSANEAVSYAADRLAVLVTLLVDVVMGQEIQAPTDIGRAATPLTFDAIEAENWFPVAPHA